MLTKNTYNWDRVRDLATKYSVAAPRYTSYPTAVEFHSGIGDAEWQQMLLDELGVPPPDATLSLYLHIPFCRQLCYFCACNKVVTQDRRVTRPYLEALSAEIERYAAIVEGNRLPVEQIHWGGGSPNYLTPAEISALHTRTRSFFPNISPGADVSVELDPRTTTEEQIAAFRESGFTRVSLGVQDFNPEVQAAVNRMQSFEMTASLVESVRKRGFSGVNVDLIYGLPAQTLAGFQDTLQQVLQIRPDRIALYGYAHVTWLHKVQNSFHRFPLPTPEERLQILLDALRTLTEAGYRYIGLDHFALPEDGLSIALDEGKLNRNFMGYTTHRGARILGFGASAISSLVSGFAQNNKSVDEYQHSCREHSTAIQRGLRRTKQDVTRAEVIERILCEGKLSLSALAARFGEDEIRRLAPSLYELTEFEKEGLVTRETDGFELTPEGRLFARNVATAFDEYLPQHLNRERKVFSQAV